MHTKIQAEQEEKSQLFKEKMQLSLKLKVQEASLGASSGEFAAEKERLIRELQERSENMKLSTDELAQAKQREEALAQQILEEKKAAAELQNSIEEKQREQEANLKRLIKAEQDARDAAKQKEKTISES